MSSLQKTIRLSLLLRARLLINSFPAQPQFDKLLHSPYMLLPLLLLSLQITPMLSLRSQAFALARLPLRKTRLFATQSTHNTSQPNTQHVLLPSILSRDSPLATSYDPASFEKEIYQWWSSSDQFTPDAKVRTCRRGYGRGYEQADTRNVTRAARKATRVARCALYVRSESVVPRNKQRRPQLLPFSVFSCGNCAARNARAAQNAS